MKGFSAWVLGSMAVLTLLLVSGLAWAESVPVEGARFNVEASMADNMKVYEGRRVILVLNSGKELIGTVKAVSGNYVHVAELDGMDFFDGLVRLDNVAAIKARFRMPKTK